MSSLADAFLTFASPPRKSRLCFAPLPFVARGLEQEFAATPIFHAIAENSYGTQNDAGSVIAACY
jgi:hypothetical protein